MIDRWGIATFACFDCISFDCSKSSMTDFGTRQQRAESSANAIQIGRRDSQTGSMELSVIQQGEGSEQIFDCVSLIDVSWDKTVGITEIFSRLKNLGRCQRSTFFDL